MTDWIDEALRGHCYVCKKVIALSDGAVGWYANWIEDEDEGGIRNDLPDLLVGVTHLGLCAEAFSEGRGDDCTWQEYQPYEFISVARLER